MSHIPTQPARSRVAAIALACSAFVGIGLAGATPASAAHWEQISKANGANGAAYFSNENHPVFASDTGTFGVVQPEPFIQWGYHGNPAPTNLRNIVANTTRAIARPLTVGPLPSERVVAFTADESKMLVRSATPSAWPHFVIRPVAGGPDVPVADGDYFDEGNNDAALSADGSTVVVDDNGPEIVNVATGATQTFPNTDYLEGMSFGHYGISDNGKVVAGSTPFSDPAGFYIAGGVLTNTPDGPSQVSPDGSKIFTLVSDNNGTGQPDRLEVTRLSDHTTRSFTLPESFTSFLWISPDGSRVAVTPGLSLPNQPTAGQALVLNTTTGQLAKFGREFSTSLDNTSAVSRNGKYAVIRYAAKVGSGPEVRESQAALVDLVGEDLPGNHQALSASSYLPVTPPISFCGGGGTMLASFGQPAPWAPLPRKGDLTVTIDGHQAVHKTFTAPTTTDVQVPFAATDKSATIKATVVDYLGRTLTTQQTIAVRCYEDQP
jgi:hypothetical protein